MQDCCESSLVVFKVIAHRELLNITILANVHFEKDR